MPTVHAGQARELDLGDRICLLRTDEHEYLELVAASAPAARPQPG